MRVGGGGGGGDTIKYVRAFLVGSFLAQLLDHLGGALVQFVEVRPLIHVHAAPGVAADAPQSGVQITEWGYGMPYKERDESHTIPRAVYGHTYGQSLSNSDFFVTNDSSDVSVSDCSGFEQAASSSWPHSSAVAGPAASTAIRWRSHRQLKVQLRAAQVICFFFCSWVGGCYGQSSKHNRNYSGPLYTVRITHCGRRRTNN